VAKTKTNILLIEDEKALLYTLGLKLEKEGYNVSKADNGKAGLEKLKQEKFDIVLMDLILPEMSGFEILENKTNTKNKDTKLLVLSNLGQNEDVDKVMKLGAVGFLIKSNNTLQNIIDKIKELLK